MQKINKPHEMNNIISFKKNDNIYLQDKNVDNSVLETFYFEDFFNPKRMKKFIKAVESMVRQSEEYSHYLGILTNTQHIDSCSVLGNIKDGEATLEYHHYPFTLYDICEIVIEKNIKENKKFTTFMIASQVIQLHYDNKVGLVKLSKTIHELVHDGKIFIPLESIAGDVNSFVEEYLDVIPRELIKKYNDLIDMNNEKNLSDEIINIHNG